jgi:hypothetical protein
VGVAHKVQHLRQAEPVAAGGVGLVHRLQRLCLRASDRRHWRREPTARAPVHSTRAGVRRRVSRARRRTANSSSWPSCMCANSASTCALYHDTGLASTCYHQPTHLAPGRRVQRRVRRLRTDGKAAAAQRINKLREVRDGRPLGRTVAEQLLALESVSDRKGENKPGKEDHAYTRHRGSGQQARTDSKHVAQLQELLQRHGPVSGRRIRPIDRHAGF